MRSTGSIIFALLFLWYLTTEVEAEYDTDHLKYFNQHISKKFLYNNDTIYLESTNFNRLRFSKSYNEIIIPIDSIQARITENAFKIKAFHTIKILKKLD